MLDDKTIQALAGNFSANQLLAAFLYHEIPFRLKEIHNLSSDQIKHMTDVFVEHFYNNSDSMFNYDVIDESIESYLKTKDVY